VLRLLNQGKTAELQRVKGHSGVPGNERADALAGKAAEKRAWSKVASVAFLKLRISGGFRTAKQAWNDNPANHGTREIPPPPPKKSCLDSARNAIARTAAQIRTNHWRSAEYLKRIKDDKCWFCRGTARMSRSHMLLHCPDASLASARAEVWEGKNPGGVRVLLANPRWERRLLKFLQLSSVGRVMGDGVDEDAARAERLDGWIVWETEEKAKREGMS